jgi:Cation transporter/ATPase, N-terminus
MSSSHPMGGRSCDWSRTAGTHGLTESEAAARLARDGPNVLPAALDAERPARGALRSPPVAGRLLDRTIAAHTFGVAGPTEAFKAFARNRARSRERR